MTNGYSRNLKSKWTVLVTVGRRIFADAGRLVAGVTGRVLHAVRLRRMRGAAERITTLVRGLQASVNNEAAFLEIGGRLQTIYGDTTQLTQDVQAAISGMTGGGDESLLDRVAGLAKNAQLSLDAHARQVALRLTRVRDVAEQLGGIEQVCDRLDRIAMNLRIVGMNIGVESTRSQAAREMFTVVFDEIVRLSQRVGDAGFRIRKDATEAMGEQMRAYDTLSEGLQAFRRLCGEAAVAVGAAQEEIAHCVGSAVAVFEQAGTRSREVSRGVGEMVMGLQFHDNMRQRVEHIIHALEAAAGAFSGDTDGTAALERYGAGVVLQKMQLNDVLSEIDRVYDSSVSAFRKIGAEVQELAGSMAEVGLGASAKNPFQKLVNGLEGLGRLLVQGNQLVGRIDQSVAAVAAAGERFLLHMEEVDAISFETKMKALNAIVKADHLGQNGRTLEVLAQEMNRLSHETDAFVLQVKQRLQQVGTLAEGLRAASGEDNGSDHEDVSAEALAAGIGDITAMRQKLDRRLEAASERAAALGEVLETATAALDFLPALAREMSGHLSGLEDVCATASLLLPAGEDACSTSVQGMDASYTMQRERDIHQRVFSGEEEGAIKDGGTPMGGSDAAGKDADITLFGEADADSPAGDTDEDALGDGVELF